MKLFTEHTASLNSSKGLCVMAILHYSLCVMNICVMPFCVMPFLRYASLRCSSSRYGYLRYGYLHYASLRYGCLRYGFLRYASLRYASFRDGHLQNRLVAIQLWIEAFMIWTILFQILILNFVTGIPP